MSWFHAFLYSIFALSLSWLVVFVFWKDYRADILREHLDRLRVELFDFCAAGRVAFHHPACIALAGLLDETSVHAARLSFARLVLCRMAWANRPDLLASWRGALESVDDLEARSFLEDLRLRMRLTLARYILSVSPWLWIPLLVRPRKGSRAFAARLPGIDWSEAMLPSAWRSD